MHPSWWVSFVEASLPEISDLRELAAIYTLRSYAGSSIHNCGTGCRYYQEPLAVTNVIPYAPEEASHR